LGGRGLVPGNRNSSETFRASRRQKKVGDNGLQGRQPDLFYGMSQRLKGKTLTKAPTDANLCDKTGDNLDLENIHVGDNDEGWKGIGYGGIACQKM